MLKAATQTQLELQTILLQSELKPLLDYSLLTEFRQQFSHGIRKYPSVLNAIFLGGQAATPGMAFLSGYQNAIRCLDPHCPDTQLAAFCVSEKGVKKPWDMTTCLKKTGTGFEISGQKGYVMLLPDDLDRLYVIAKDQTEHLRCVYFQSNTTGLVLAETLRAPFIEDIPHSSVRFESLLISNKQLMPIDGHTEANKPFRYWEDVHVTLAMMAWMFRCLYDLPEKTQQVLQQDLQQHMLQLVDQFKTSPNYYCLDSFGLFDACQAILDQCGNNLLPKQHKQWQKDRMLLQMGYKIRTVIQAKMQR